MVDCPFVHEELSGRNTAVFIEKLVERSVPKCKDHGGTIFWITASILAEAGGN
jgi:hypothetical protein